MFAVRSGWRFTHGAHQSFSCEHLDIEPVRSRIRLQVRCVIDIGREESLHYFVDRIRGMKRAVSSKPNDNVCTAFLGRVRVPGEHVRQMTPEDVPALRLESFG